MASYEKFRKELFADPSARKGYERHRASVMAGELVREWRKSAGLTQAVLAEKISTSQEAISKIESAAGSRGPHIGTLVAIADACGLDFKVVTVERESAAPAAVTETPGNQISVSFADDADTSADEELQNLRDQISRHFEAKSQPRLEHVHLMGAVLPELVIPSITPAVSAILREEIIKWIRQRKRPVKIKSELSVIEQQNTHIKVIFDHLSSILRLNPAETSSHVADEV